MRRTKRASSPPVRWVSSLVLLAAGLHAARAPAGEVFTPEHVARLRYVTSARISPDGRHIACSLSVPRRPFEDEDGPAWSELHVIRPDGKQAAFRDYAHWQSEHGSVLG